jgi:DNA-binding transcriptional MerR regulator
VSTGSPDEPFVTYVTPVGTAKDLAKSVNRKLLGYGIKHANRATERTIRFYATKGLIDKPTKGDEDGRKALFGQRQLYQACLLLALGPRGYKLDSVRRVHKSADIDRMDYMLRLVATSEAQVDATVLGRNDIVT